MSETTSRVGLCVHERRVLFRSSSCGLGQILEGISTTLLRQQIFSPRVCFSAEVKMTFLGSLMMTGGADFSYSFNFAHVCFRQFQTSRRDAEPVLSPALTPLLSLSSILRGAETPNTPTPPSSSP